MDPKGMASNDLGRREAIRSPGRNTGTLWAVDERVLVSDEALFTRCSTVSVRRYADTTQENDTWMTDNGTLNKLQH